MLQRPGSPALTEREHFAINNKTHRESSSRGWFSAIWACFSEPVCFSCFDFRAAMWVTLRLPGFKIELSWSLLQFFDRLPLVLQMWSLLSLEKRSPWLPKKGWVTFSPKHKPCVLGAAIKRCNSTTSVLPNTSNTSKCVGGFEKYYCECEKVVWSLKRLQQESLESDPVTHVWQFQKICDGVKSERRELPGRL